MATVGEIAAFLKQFAPTDLAEEWDNVGLLIGNRTAPVQRAITCLTLAPEVAAEAIQQKAQLIVTHHPVMFRPVQKLTADDSQGKMLLELIAAGVAVYSPHTGYDSAAGGINQQIAELLNLSEIQPLRPAAKNDSYAIVCYVPEKDLSAVQDGLWKAGAGEIGEYSKCSFFHPGTGTFQGSDESNPTIGHAGAFEQVSEVRLEVKVSKDRLAAALQAMCAAHPYEEPAYFIHPLAASPVRKFAGAAEAGTGRSGRLGSDSNSKSPKTLGEFLETVRTSLKVPKLEYCGERQQPVTKVAIACGSGAELLRDAIKQGCDVFLTGEARFHSFLEAQASSIALVAIGHYASERPALERLSEILSERFGDLQCQASRSERDPIQWLS